MLKDDMIKTLDKMDQLKKDMHNTNMCQHSP